MAVVLRVDKLCKVYRMGDETVRALDGASLEANKGEFVALMGVSGSGKSTLLHLIGGLDIPTAGSVEIEGENLAHMGDRARTLFRRRRIGIVFQSLNLLPSLSAAENVSLPLLLAGRSNDATAKARAQLEAVDIAHRAHHRPEAMSGGEQQRVAIARALINEPALLLADEPTGNLDSGHAEQIWTLLSRLAHDRGCTIVAVTHEASGAAYADRVIMLKDGRVVGQLNNHGQTDASLVAARYQELAG